MPGEWPLPQWRPQISGTTLLTNAVAAAPRTTGMSTGGNTRKYTVIETECGQYVYDAKSTHNAATAFIWEFLVHGSVRRKKEEQVKIGHYRDANVETAACQTSQLSYPGLPTARNGDIPVAGVQDRKTTLPSFGVEYSRQLCLFKLQHTMEWRRPQHNP